MLCRWGIFGTMETARATNSGGGDSCLARSPALYLMSGYSVAMYWILKSCFLCWAFKEIGSIVMEKQRISNLHAKKKQLEREKELEEKARQEAEEEAELQAKLDEEERQRLEQEERDRLYASSDEEDGPESGADAQEDGEDSDDEDLDLDDDDDVDDDDDLDEDEEVDENDEEDEDDSDDDA